MALEQIVKVPRPAGAPRFDSEGPVVILRLSEQNGLKKLILLLWSVTIALIPLMETVSPFEGIVEECLMNGYNVDHFSTLQNNGFVIKHER